ncbi:inositol polyphosphate-5-phosphatase A-like isoform X2 [Hyla sarda]|uniref:inositol polyphosphate-5-phosphatase A-like isoform X2 n=1 Tax=Hyla sarda TaxID=327740 RepID=UPI0024C2D451|nr:inositol polyphosphate-5-phosphatase A-like isoform X2 [Hyla sarda]
MSCDCYPGGTSDQVTPRVTYGLPASLPHTSPGWSFSLLSLLLRSSAVLSSVCVQSVGDLKVQSCSRHQVKHWLLSISSTAPCVAFRSMIFKFAWTRKGFMRTRWLVNDRMFDLVNLHLFHDASNLVSCDCSPSVYSANRRRALYHVLTRLKDDCNAPFFLFGDFNFRLDLKSLIQAQGWSSGDTDGHTAVYEQDGEVQLLMKCKRFEHQNSKVFQDDNEHMLLRFDHEPIPFLNELTEVQISFPPSYPFSENVSKPSEFMGTRCPAWCDRVFMSLPARALLHNGKHGEASVQYGRIGGDICMGDHKPVFLYFEMETVYQTEN